MRKRRWKKTKMQNTFSSAKKVFGSFCLSANNLDVQSIVRYPRTTKVRLFNLFGIELEIVRNWQLGSLSLFPLCIVTFTGAQVVAKMTCTRGHRSEWSSCPNVGTKKTSAASINIDLTSSVFLSGLRFDRVKVNF